MVDKIEPPFSEEQISFLKEYQKRPNFHPYTCGYDSEHILVPTEEGWMCPHDDYTQSHALKSSLDVMRHFPSESEPN